MNATASPPTLLRAVSRWEVVGLSVNDVIGSGIYLLPAAAAALIGSSSVWAVPAAGVCVLLLVLCFAEAGSRFDAPGGGFAYTRAAFGELVGFEVGWMTWIARVTSMASLSAGFAQALSGVWETAAVGPARALTIVVSLGGLTWIHVRGVKHGVRTSMGLVIGKTLPLLLLIGAGLFALDWDRIRAIPPPATSSFGEAALLLLFAYAGFENTAAPAGEFKNPRRDVPFALFVMIAFVTAVYTVVQLVAVSVVPNLPASATPLADAAAALVGPWGVWVLTLGAAISILGTNSNTVLAGSRYLYVLAQTGALPSALTRVHPSYRTPWIAILVQSAIALPLALTGTFAGLAALSVVARMATYIGTAAAVPVLRRKMPATPNAVRVPGGPLIPIAALVVCAALLASATTANLIAGAVAILLGAALYLTRRGHSSK